MRKDFELVVILRKLLRRNRKYRVTRVNGVGGVVWVRVQVWGVRIYFQLRGSEVWVDGSRDWQEDELLFVCDLGDPDSLGKLERFVRDWEDL